MNYDTMEVVLTSEEKYDIFSEVERLFRDRMDEKTGKNARLQQNLNICCDDNDMEFIIEIGDIIKDRTTQKFLNDEEISFNELSYRNVYFVLILLFYSLKYNEQTEDWLNIGFLNRSVYKSELNLAKNLLFGLSSGDIIIYGYFGVYDLSSSVRRYILGFNGGRNSKTRKRKGIKKRKPKKRTGKNKSRFV